MKKIVYMLIWLNLGINTLYLTAADPEQAPVIKRANCCKECCTSHDRLKFMAGCCYALENLQETWYKKTPLKQYKSYKENHRRTLSDDGKASFAQGQRWLLNNARIEGQADEDIEFTIKPAYKCLSDVVCCQCFDCCKGKKICTRICCCGCCKSEKKRYVAPTEQTMERNEKRSTLTPELRRLQAQDAAKIAAAINNRVQLTPRAQDQKSDQR